MLLDLCLDLVKTDSPERRGERDAYRAELGALHDKQWAAWQATAEREAALSPVATSRLASEVWSVISEHDWV